MQEADRDHLIVAIDLQMEQLETELMEVVSGLHASEVKAKQIEASLFNLWKQRREILID